MKLARRVDQRLARFQRLPDEILQFVDVGFHDVGHGFERRGAAVRRSRRAPPCCPARAKKRGQLAIDRRIDARRDAASEDDPGRLERRRARELLAQRLDILRRRRDAGKVDVGRFAARRVADLDAHPRLAGDAHEMIGDIFALEAAPRNRGVLAAEESGRRDAVPVVRERGRDVHAFAAGIGAHALDAIDRAGGEVGNRDGLIDRRIERDGDDLEDGSSS